MSHARSIRPGTTYLVTRRTERRHCLLRPDRRMNELIEQTLVASAAEYGILVHAFCAMSTHLHYVVTDPHGRLPQFMASFHRAVALGVQKIRNWEGAVWNQSQPSVVELCTRQAMVEKIAYTIANPVLATLVRYAHEWPGVKTSAHDMGNRIIHAKRHRFRPSLKKSKTGSNLFITLPPSISDADANKFWADVEAEVQSLERSVHSTVPRHQFLGAKRVMEVDPESRITTRQPRRQLNPTFAVGRGNPIALAQAKRALREFRQSYRNAIEQWRSGNREVRFPIGTYAMRVFHGANVVT